MFSGDRCPVCDAPWSALEAERASQRAEARLRRALDEVLPAAGERDA